MAKIKNLCKQLSETPEYIAVAVAVKTEQPEEAKESARSLLLRIEKGIVEISDNIRGAVIRQPESSNPILEGLLEIFTTSKYDHALKTQYSTLFAAAEIQVDAHMPYLKPWYDKWFGELDQGSETVQ